MNMVWLFGAWHGTDTYLPWFYGVKSLTAEPKLLSVLDNFKAGTKVGLELYQDLSDEDPILKQLEKKFKLKLQNPESWTFYWSKVLGYCKQKGFNIIYLDDYDLVKQYTEHYIKADLLEIKVNKIIKKELKKENIKKRFTLEAEIYKERIKGDYKLMFERTGHLLKAIEETSPDVAIIGASHCPYLLKQKPEMFEKFLVETPLNKEIIGFGDRSIRLSLQDRMDEDEWNLSLQNMYSKKKFLQLKELEEKNADYTGTWELTDTGGLFFMYIQERKREGSKEKIAGRIIDTIGNASFYGEIDENCIKFTKKYDKEAISLGAYHDEILYKSENNKEIIRGGFLLRGLDQSYFERFVMIEGDPKQWKLPKNPLHV